MAYRASAAPASGSSVFYEVVGRLFLIPLILILLGAVFLFAIAFGKKDGWFFVHASLLLFTGGLWGWLISSRWKAIIDAVPLSAISSAKSGYVMLEGTAEALPGSPMLSAGTGEQCCWYGFSREAYWYESGVFGRLMRGVIPRRDPDGRYDFIFDRWEETSDWSFTVRDSSGSCVVSPHGATVLPVRREHVEGTGLRDMGGSEDLVLPGDPVMVIGELRTGTSAQELQARTNDLLSEWKADQVALMKKFDLDGDGRLSEKEWQLARNAAQRAAKAAVPSSVPPKAVAKPTDGRPFLISALRHDRLASYVHLWNRMFLALGAAGIAIALWGIVRHLAR